MRARKQKMKISELIAYFDELKNKFGDLDVMNKSKYYSDYTVSDFSKNELRELFNVGKIDYFGDSNSVLFRYK